MIPFFRLAQRELDKERKNSSTVSAKLHEYAERYSVLETKYSKLLDEYSDSVNKNKIDHTWLDPGQEGMSPLEALHLQLDAYKMQLKSSEDIRVEVEKEAEELVESYQSLHSHSEALVNQVQTLLIEKEELRKELAVLSVAMNNLEGKKNLNVDELNTEISELKELYSSTLEELEIVKVELEKTQHESNADELSDHAEASHRLLQAEYEQLQAKLDEVTDRSNYYLAEMASAAEERDELVAAHIALEEEMKRLAQENERLRVELRLYNENGDGLKNGGHSAEGLDFAPGGGAPSPSVLHSLTTLQNAMTLRQSAPLSNRNDAKVSEPEYLARFADIRAEFESRSPEKLDHRVVVERGQGGDLLGASPVPNVDASFLSRRGDSEQILYAEVGGFETRVGVWSKTDQTFKLW